MRINFTANISRGQVNEKSSFSVLVNVLDDSDREGWVLQVPTSLKYRLDCLSTNAVILDWTSLAADDETTLAITADQNRIQSDCNEYERKQLTVKCNDGLSTQYQETWTWQVKNLSGQT